MSVIQEKIVNNGHGKLNASYFCVHSTANVGATAANHVSLWSRGYAYAVHLVSDWKEAYHTVPYNRLCYQVGNGNRYVEGLEICEATNAEDFKRGVLIAAQVVRERLAAHGWGIDKLICHNEATKIWGGSDHTDPLPYFTKWGYSWEQFKQLVQNGDIDMALTDDDIMRLWTHKLPNGRAARDIISDATSDVIRLHDGGAPTINMLQATLTAQAEALKTLANAVGANPTDIAATVEKAVKEKLDSIDIKMIAKAGN